MASLSLLSENQYVTEDSKRLRRQFEIQQYLCPCLEYLKKEHIDYFIFGHRHIAIEYSLAPNSTYINLGDWIRYDSYAEFSGDELKLKYYKAKIIYQTFRSE